MAKHDEFKKERALEYDRLRVEGEEHWRRWVFDIPFLRFRPEWEVKVIPPFLGAMARFQVRKDSAWVSAYLDVYTRLSGGGMGEGHTPHWEIYPAAGDDNGGVDRFAMNDVDGLMAAIHAAIEEQLANAAAEREAA